LAITLARHSIHAMQNELKALQSDHAQYAYAPYGVVAASHIVTVEFAAIAAATNDYLR
jgi:hypothetical protein